MEINIRKLLRALCSRSGRPNIQQQEVPKTHKTQHARAGLDGPMTSQFGELVCGRSTGGTSPSEIAEIMSFIKATIDRVVEELAWLSNEDDKRVSMLGPFLGRSLLELSTTALVGRLDPLRLLVVRQIQSQPAYDPGARWRASMQWQGDVVAAKPVKDLWTDTVQYDGITKALLGDYYDHLLWQPAHQRLLAASPTGGSWLADLARIPAESFVPRKRDEITRLYSSLSKGIHHEFVMPPGALYDRTTVVDLVQRAVRVVSDIAVASHFVPHCQFGLPAGDALGVFNSVEIAEVLK